MFRAHTDATINTGLKGGQPMKIQRTLFHIPASAVRLNHALSLQPTEVLCMQLRDIGVDYRASSERTTLPTRWLFCNQFTENRDNENWFSREVRRSCTMLGKERSLPAILLLLT